ncbi:MAG: hypothetical protein NXH75_13720, partial [Halobacteriovoraceae bacterium]|nr:hypothetical protein [Halobacteriovoraceae bacterium]
MKLRSILILIIFSLLFSSKNIFALGSDLEFGLTSRGGLVLSNEARSYEEIDIGELISMGSTIPGVFFRQENPELREIGINFGTLLSQVRSLTSTPEERANAAHQISQLLIQLRSDHPETFNEIQRLERERRGYDFDTEDLPSYCENFPNISSEDLQVFYSQEGVDPNLSTCFRNVGEYAVNNDIERVSEVMRAIQAESLDPQLAEFRARMMSEVANGILNQRGIYGGLSGTPESLYPSCFSDSNAESLFNKDLFQRDFQRDFNTSKERGNADSASRENLLRSSLSSTLYQQVLRLYKNDILPPPVVARQERGFECRTDLALRQGLIFEFASIPNRADMSVYCYSEEYLLLRFENDEQCLEAYNNFFDGSTNDEYQACINSQETNHSHTNAHQLVDAVMAEQLKESPLLFRRSRQGLGNSSASPMARKLNSLPGMENLLRRMLPELGSGLANFNERFDVLLSENQAEIERIYQAALQDEEVTQSIDQEINDYQEALDNSLNEMCENGGENLHHIPELVSSVRQSMVENSSGELSREEALVRSQNMECYLLREYPPEDDGQLHPALYYLGIAGGTALAFVNPLLGAGVILGVEGVNSYTRITATQAQLEDVLASAHGGFSSQEQLERNRRIRDGAIV